MYLYSVIRLSNSSKYSTAIHIQCFYVPINDILRRPKTKKRLGRYAETKKGTDPALDTIKLQLQQ